MATKKRPLQAERMTPEEIAFWMQAALQALPDCLDIKRTPEYCAHIAGESADALVDELRRRVRA